MTLREYVDQVNGLFEKGGHSNALYRLLAEKGEDNVFTPLPEGEEYGLAKVCFANATHRALNADLFGDGDLTYYEGFVDTGLMPVLHAWVQDPEGRVYELTLRHNDERCPFCHGEGELHPRDHWAYEGDGDAEDWDYDDEARIKCDQCEDGKVEPRDLTGTTYLGVPIDSTLLRESIIETGTYGVLDGNTKVIERLAARH